MIYLDDDIYPVTRLTAGVIGDAGRRVFVLQAHYGADAVSWVIHKEHALALSRTIPRLLADVRAEFPELEEPLVAAQPNLALKEPPYPRFRVGSMGLGYDRVHDLVVLTLVDANAEQAAAAGALPEESAPDQVYVFATRGQALLLGQHVEAVVAAGRPLCPRCGDPMDDCGHFCLPPITRRKLDGLLVQ
jgi:uncharacterized repeat protein (TIGR03847 family)